ncbi:MAG: hypothetical protein MUC57_02540 [Desulfobacterales bacterium]|jgi:hypothetical protein|nr:hypothetical protein [Desulfobacterales bacterium]
MVDLKFKQPPECFASIENVFPLGPDGLRQTPAGCLECELKTECLRTALGREQGVAVHEERLARAYQAGNVGFLERWARQKKLEQRKRITNPWRRFWMRLQRSSR